MADRHVASVRMVRLHTFCSMSAHFTLLLAKRYLISAMVFMIHLYSSESLGCSLMEVRPVCVACASASQCRDRRSVSLRLQTAILI
jgi:hypothetical protein